MRETLRRCYHARLRKTTRFARSAEVKTAVLAHAAGGRFHFSAKAMSLGSFTVAHVANQNGHAGLFRPQHFDGPAVARLIQADGLNDASAIRDVATPNLNALARQNNAAPGSFTTGTRMHFVGVRCTHSEPSRMGSAARTSTWL